MSARSSARAWLACAWEGLIQITLRWAASAAPRNACIAWVVSGPAAAATGVMANVPIRPEVGSHHSAEVLFGRAVGRSVVVGEVKVCDALVEGVPQHLALHVEGTVVAEVVPETERDSGQDQTRLANSAIRHGVIAILRRPPRIQGVWHTLVVEIDVHAFKLVRPDPPDSPAGGVRPGASTAGESLPVRGCHVVTTSAWMATTIRCIRW